MYIYLLTIGTPCIHMGLGEKTASLKQMRLVTQFRDHVIPKVGGAILGPGDLIK